MFDAGIIARRWPATKPTKSAPQPTKGLTDLAQGGRAAAHNSTAAAIHWQLLPKSLSSLGEISEIGPMPTRNVSLTPEQDAFIDEMLEAGEYRNASEAMRDAIRALQQRRAEEALRLDKLRVAIQQGVAALDRGDYTEVEDEDLDAYLDDLATSDRR
jgi:antitoxin ParD1/3/4